MNKVETMTDYITWLPEGEEVSIPSLARELGLSLKSTTHGSLLDGMKCVRFDHYGVRREKFYVRKGEVTESMVGNPLCTGCVLNRKRIVKGVPRSECPRQSG